METGSTGEVSIHQEAFNDPGETPLPMALEKIFRQQNIPLNSLAHVFINRGPGSYTGIRMALAAAQGLSLAADCHAGLSFHFCTTLDVLEWRLSQEAENPGIVAVGTYAQQKQVIVRWLTPNPNDGAADNKGDQIIDTADLIEMLGKMNGRITGPDMEKHLPEEFLSAITPEARDLFSAPSNQVEADTLHQVEPVYVRIQEFVKAPPAQFSGLPGGE